MKYKLNHPSFVQELGKEIVSKSELVELLKSMNIEDTKSQIERLIKSQIIDVYTSPEDVRKSGKKESDS